MICFISSGCFPFIVDFFCLLRLNRVERPQKCGLGNHGFMPFVIGSWQGRGGLLHTFLYKSNPCPVYFEMNLEMSKKDIFNYMVFGERI